PPILSRHVARSIVEVGLLRTYPEGSIQKCRISQLLRQFLCAISQHFRRFVHGCKTPIRCMWSQKHHAANDEGDGDSEITPGNSWRERTLRPRGRHHLRRRRFSSRNCRRKRIAARQGGGKTQSRAGAPGGIAIQTTQNCSLDCWVEILDYAGKWRWSSFRLLAAKVSQTGRLECLLPSE